jgi:hypothetical protein
VNIPCETWSEICAMCAISKTLRGPAQTHLTTFMKLPQLTFLCSHCGKSRSGACEYIHHNQDLYHLDLLLKSWCGVLLQCGFMEVQVAEHTRMRTRHEAESACETGENHANK